MASKALQPHALTVADKLLASSIILPDDVRIISATFFPSTAATAPVHSLELARRAILSRNQSSSLLESYLTNVRVAKTTSGIYAFRIVSPDAFADTIALFQAMRFDGIAPRLIVHPLLSATPHLPLLSLLPLPAGTPIHLLPHGTPAYFLAPYKGPTSGLVSQFNETFLGHGVAGWDKDIPSSRTTKERGPQLDDKQSRHTGSPAFVIAWISVENKQGEEKGLSIIWPTSLCAASLDPSPRLLSHIPELPTELQPSPPPVKPTSTVSESGLGSGLFSPLPGALTPSVAALSPTADVLQPQAINDVPYYVSQLSTSLASSPTSDTLRAFRSLTVTRSKKVPQVAAEVGEYVGHVARERERQRDQMRKDRELQASPGNHRATPNASSASITATTPSSAPVTVPVATAPSFDATTPDDDESHDGLFYPSPPQTHPPVPIIAMLDVPQAPEATPEVLPPAEEPAAVDPTPSSSNAPADTSTFNPFGNIDMSWSEPIQATGDNFLDMDMNIDFGMSFNMDMNNESTSTNTAPARTYQRVEVDYDDPFTEDDFSYFDSKPSKPIDEHLPTIIPSAPTVVIDPLTNSGLAPAGGSAALGLGWSPPSFGDLNFSGPGPPQANSPLKMHWPDGFTPRFGDAEPTPALSPPSPGQSPMSNVGPLTPVVHIEDSGSSLADVLDAKHGSDLFGPIPFADTHKFADGKYTMGKFSLPPASEDTDQSYQPPGFRRRRSKYEEATDPRVGLVRKLIGVKRKSTSQHAVRRSSTTSFDDEWEVKYDTEEPESEVESDPGDVEETNSPLVTRPSTPPPSYLPLGPSLLHTQFHHSHLLPLSTPLRPPNMVVAPTNISTVSGPMFAPTPVSPAAALGAASEKSKSLEAAAVMISKEVVENSIWADAWFATDETNGQAQRADPWHADINYVFRLLSEITSLQTPLDLQNLWGIGSDSASTSLRLADMPSVVVSKNEAVVEVLPTVIRFWEKLAVGPKGGTKDITAYVLFEEEDESQTRGIEVWLQNLSASYQVGTLVALFTHPHLNESPDRISIWACTSPEEEVPLAMACYPYDLTNLFGRIWASSLSSFLQTLS
ncbi:hypothetical protein ONZ45_g7637 [Pleurotus djamor]|nr:hypothetical protein ONZ45_g7637 [Pleurotus djamor]